MWISLEKDVKLSPSLPSDKMHLNSFYLKELKTDNLLLPYREEAGLAGLLNYRLKDVHGGWDSPLSQIRGTFTGHWLSAVAHIYAQTGDKELKVRGDFVVSEIKRCQEANGGRWLFPIPEKYLLRLKEGGRFWASFYVCHKVIMGLVDMHLYAQNSNVLPMLSQVADWFVEYSQDISREQMNKIMDVEETGGIVEIWATLYSLTKDERYKTLMIRFQRPTFMEGLLQKKDVTTNMHANIQIPEVHGMAKCYEVTGEIKYREAVEEFWRQTVTERGAFATGSQTCGEVWTPPGRQISRLGETNQEHCVVYNMIRLADYLYRWTGDAIYADYIERNIYNGIFAQGFWQGRAQDSLCEYEAETGLVSYYLPLSAGSHKKWGSKTQDFWCCHCTLVQANSIYNKFYLHQKNNELRIGQYFPFTAKTEINNISVNISLEVLSGGGNMIKINDYTASEKPQSLSVKVILNCENSVNATVGFRIPWWAKGDVTYETNCKVKAENNNGFLMLTGDFSQTEITVHIPRGITLWPLADATNYNAFLDGPVLLAGIVNEERQLVSTSDQPLLVPHEEKKWHDWSNQYKTIGQPINFVFKPIYDIGFDKYTVYFPMTEKSNR